MLRWHRSAAVDIRLQKLENLGATAPPPLAGGLDWRAVIEHERVGKCEISGFGLVVIRDPCLRGNHLAYAA